MFLNSHVFTSCFVSVVDDKFVRDPVKFSNQSTTYGQTFNDFFSTRKGYPWKPYAIFFFHSCLSNLYVQGPHGRWVFKFFISLLRTKDADCICSLKISLFQRRILLWLLLMLKQKLKMQIEA